MTAAIRQAFIGMGANLGDREASLRGAIARLRAVAGIAALESSGAYETEPIGLTQQPRFINLVLGAETRLSPEALLRELQRIEAEFGRVRTVRWGPRTLDLDLLAYEGETRQTPVLVLPHPRMLERAFVVVPLRDLLRRPRFQRPEWDPLRAQVRQPLPDEAGVKAYPPWNPPV